MFQFHIGFEKSIHLLYLKSLQMALVHPLIILSDITRTRFFYILSIEMAFSGRNAWIRYWFWKKYPFFTLIFKLFIYSGRNGWNFKNYPFTSFRIVDVLKNYQSRWLILSETLRVLILQFRLQISNLYKSVQEYCLR